MYNLKIGTVFPLKILGPHLELGGLSSLCKLHCLALRHAHNSRIPETSHFACADRIRHPGRRGCAGRRGRRGRLWGESSRRPGAHRRPGGLQWPREGRAGTRPGRTTRRRRRSKISAVLNRTDERSSSRAASKHTRPMRLQQVCKARRSRGDMSGFCGGLGRSTFS